MESVPFFFPEQVSFLFPVQDRLRANVSCGMIETKFEMRERMICDVKENENEREQNCPHQ